MSLIFGNIYLLMVARLLIGLSTGPVAAVCLLYVSQIAKHKGFVLQAAYASSLLGNLLVLEISRFLSSQYSSGTIADIFYVVQVGCCAVVALVVIFVPNYPPWLQWRGRLEEANENRHQLAQREFPEIEVACSWKQLFVVHGGTVGRTLTVQFFLFFCGACWMGRYAPFLLQESNFEFDPLMYSLDIHCQFMIPLAFAILTFPLAQYTSSKDSIINGYFCSGCAYFAIFAIYMKCGTPSEASVLQILVPLQDVAVLRALYYFVVSQYVAWVCVPSMLYTIESFSPEARTKGIFLVVATAYSFYDGSMVLVSFLLTSLNVWTILALAIITHLGMIVLMFFPNIGVSEEDQSDLEYVSRSDTESHLSKMSVQKPYPDSYISSSKSIKLKSDMNKISYSQSPPRNGIFQASEPSIVTAASQKEGVDVGNASDQDSTNSSATVVLRSARAHQSVKSPHLGHHLSGLWSGSDVGWSQNTAYKQETHQQRDPPNQREDHNHGLFYSTNKSVFLFGEQKVPTKRGFLNANSGDTTN
ncbi:hypothetical protein QG37_04102 [Candidozyma auris]|nr:hypothetical protein QG37_04102 [[Candida] auris]